jgi:four helix bundle protein
MKINKFEDIISWKKSGRLTINIYSLFNNCKDYSYTNQIKRATISIMNNIAEGFERNTNKEFRNFLFIAKGSCAEVRSILYVGYKLRYLNKKQFKILLLQTMEISKLLSGLIKTL